MANILVFFSKNRIEIISLNDGRRSEGIAVFTTTRLLAGNFEVAHNLLSKLLKELGAVGFFKRRPKLLIQPLEMTEGGLSMVEKRVFLELGMGSGARSVKLHVGPRLSTQEATQLLSEDL